MLESFRSRAARVVGAVAALAAALGVSLVSLRSCDVDLPRGQGDPMLRIKMCIDVLAPANPPDGAQGLAALRGGTWEPGTELRVKFLEGSAYQRAMAFRAISEWSRHCNVRFRRVESGPAEIRVTFRQGQGSWSYIGKGGAAVPQSKPTMNLGWLTDRSPESEWHVATHEAGHALGFVHGQNAPNAPIPWDVVKVFRYFSGPPNYWDAQTTYRNVIMRYTGNEVIAGPWDRDSIMQYPVDNALTVGDFEVGWNTRISPGDSQMARVLYPYPSDRAPWDRPARRTPIEPRYEVACPDPRGYLVPAWRSGDLSHAANR